MAGSATIEPQEASSRSDDDRIRSLRMMQLSTFMLRKPLSGASSAAGRRRDSHPMVRKWRSQYATVDHRRSDGPSPNSRARTGPCPLEVASVGLRVFDLATKDGKRLTMSTGRRKSEASEGFGERVRRLRIERGWTQEQLARQANLSKSAIS